MASSRACCTHYIYNVPATMDEEEINEMLRPLIRNGDEKFIKQKSLDIVKCRLVLTFKKPVELLEESAQFHNHQIYILPEMVEKTVVVLNKQWTDKLKLVKLNSVVLPGVSVVTNNGIVTLEGKKETVDQSLVKLQEAIVERLLLQNVNAENSGAEMKTSGWQESPGKDDSHKNRKLKLGFHQSDLSGKEPTEEDPSGDSCLRHNSFGSHLVDNDLHKLAVNSSAAQQKESKSDDATKSSNASPSGRNITATKVADYQKPLADQEIDKLVDGVGNISVNSRDSESPLMSDVNVENVKILKPPRPQAGCSSSPPSQCDSHTPTGKKDQQNSPPATDLVLPQTSDVGIGGKLPDYHGGPRVNDVACEHNTTAFGDTQEILPVNPSHTVAQEMNGDVRECQGNSEKTETVGSQSATQDALSVSAGTNASNSAAADAVNGEDQRSSRPSTASNGNDGNASKPDCFVIEEVIWQFILFSEPNCGYKDLFIIKLCEDDNKKIVLKGTTDNVQKFKAFYGAKQRVLERSIKSRMQRIPEGYTAGTFKNVLDNLAKNKVLVRSTTDAEFCEVIGKFSDLEDLSQAVKIHFPGDKAATKKDIKPHVNDPLPPVSAVTSSPTAAKATPFFGSQSSQSAHVNSHPTSPTSAVAAPNYLASQSSWPPPVIPLNSMPDCLEFCLKRSEIIVSVITGNILEQCCEVIVSPTSYKLDNRGGLAKVIANAAGHTLQLACQKYIDANEYLPVGKVMHTTCGVIPPPARKVIHACGPNMREFKDQNLCAVALKATFFNCLVTANDELTARSIALPAISSGTFGVPYDAVGLAACLAVIQFDEHRSPEENKWLKEIKFVNINEDVTKVMVNKFMEVLQTYKSAQGVANQQQGAFRPLDYQKQPEYKNFCSLANRQGFSVVDVPRNGDSALYAIIDQLKRRGIICWDVTSLRKEGAKHLCRNQSLINWTAVKDDHNNDFSQYFRWLETCDNFCDENLLRGLAEVINMEIHLLHDNDNLTIFNSPTSHSHPLCIGLTSDGYYVSLIPASSMPGHQYPSNISGNRSSAGNILAQPSSILASASQDLKELQTAADKRGLVIVPVQTGGDSALHAIIDQLNLQGTRSAYNVLSLRQEVVKYLEGHGSLIDNETLRMSHAADVNSYLMKQSTSGTPCDATMLTAVAEVIHHEIRILHKSGRFIDIDCKTATGTPLLIGLPVNDLFVSLHAKNLLSQNTTQGTSQISQKVSLECVKSDQLSISVDADYNNLLSHTDELGLVIVNVPSDGDCGSAYHAVIDQLYRQGCTGYENDVTGLRKKSVEYLKSHRDRFSSQFLVNPGGDLETYILQQLCPGSRCDELMLRCMAEVVQHNIHILPGNGCWTKLETNSATGKPLFVGLVGEDHYVSLCSHDSVTCKDEPNIIRERQNQSDVHMATSKGITVENKQDKTKESCPICMDDIDTPRKLPCGHVFCANCIDKSFSYQKKCPCCGKIFGELKGDQPEGGTMRMRISAIDLEGYPRCGSIIIDYDIPSGRQKDNHPNPGEWYQGAHRTAYLPNNSEGQEISSLLRHAFNAGLIFTVGRSTTSGRENVVTWNDIHHKTKLDGPFGYPDASYLSRVRDELAAKGITSDSLSVNPSVETKAYKDADKFTPTSGSVNYDGSTPASTKGNTPSASTTPAMPLVGKASIASTPKCDTSASDQRNAWTRDKTGWMKSGVVDAGSEKSQTVLDDHHTTDPKNMSCALCNAPTATKGLHCGHVFCSVCLSKNPIYQQKCPCCAKPLGIAGSTQPEGATMEVCTKKFDLPGYVSCGSIVIEYKIPDGVQKAIHPNPGKRYFSDRRTAYLPNNSEGREICSLLRHAFDAGITFTIGRSSFGCDNSVVWNGIEHKTALSGHMYSYPDPTYLQRVRSQLADRGIVSVSQNVGVVTGLPPSTNTSISTSSTMTNSPTGHPTTSSSQGYNTNSSTADAAGVHGSGSSGRNRSLYSNTNPQTLLGTDTSPTTNCMPKTQGTTSSSPYSASASPSYQSLPPTTSQQGSSGFSRFLPSVSGLRQSFESLF